MRLYCLQDLPKQGFCVILILLEKNSLFLFDISMLEI